MNRKPIRKPRTKVQIEPFRIRLQSKHPLSMFGQSVSHTPKRLQIVFGSEAINRDFVPSKGPTTEVSREKLSFHPGPHPRYVTRGLEAWGACPFRSKGFRPVFVFVSPGLPRTFAFHFHFNGLFVLFIWSRDQIMGFWFVVNTWDWTSSSTGKVTPGRTSCPLLRVMMVIVAIFEGFTWSLFSFPSGQCLKNDRLPTEAVFNYKLFFE